MVATEVLRGGATLLSSSSVVHFSSVLVETVFVIGNVAKVEAKSAKAGSRFWSNIFATVECDECVRIGFDV